MKQIKTDWTRTQRSDSFKNPNWKRVVFFGSFMTIFSFTSTAQFININIEIPAKTGVSEMETSDSNWQAGLNQSGQELEKTYSMIISSAENLLVIASLKHSDYLIDSDGVGIKMRTSLSFCNDGINKPSKANASDTVFFPMSTSGRLIDNMKDSPQLLNAYIIVHTSIERPPRNNSVFSGNIVLTIEYN